MKTEYLTHENRLSSRVTRSPLLYMVTVHDESKGRKGRKEGRKGAREGRKEGMNK